MTLAHESAHVDDINEDEDIDGGEWDEELGMALTRAESQLMFEKVMDMSRKWDDMELNVAAALNNDKIQAARQDRLDGRVVKIEDRVGVIEQTIGRHKRQSDPSELSDLERTQNGVRVKIPIERASQMIAAEKNEGELRELLSRYRWWKGTLRDVAWGTTKLAGKAIATGALGWLLHAAYLYVKSH